jgi:hypothetical protein
MGIEMYIFRSFRKKKRENLHRKLQIYTFKKKTHGKPSSLEKAENPISNNERNEKLWKKLEIVKNAPTVPTCTCLCHLA